MVVLAIGPFATLPRPCQTTSRAKSRSIAYITAWRKRLSSSGALRLFSHMKDSGEKNSQPLVVMQLPGSFDRRSTSKFSTEPPGSTSTLPVS